MHIGFLFNVVLGCLCPDLDCLWPSGQIVLCSNCGIDKRSLPQEHKELRAILRDTKALIDRCVRCTWELSPQHKSDLVAGRSTETNLTALRLDLKKHAKMLAEVCRKLRNNRVANPTDRHPQNERRIELNWLIREIEDLVVTRREQTRFIQTVTIYHSRFKELDNQFVTYSNNVAQKRVAHAYALLCWQRAREISSRLDHLLCSLQNEPSLEPLTVRLQMMHDQQLNTASELRRVFQSLLDNGPFRDLID